MKTYIGLVGEKGGGKDTFTNILTGLLANKTIGHIKSSDLLSETLKIWDLPLTRSNLQEIAILLDQGFGKGTVTHGVYEKMKANPSDVVIFDGIRWKTDAEMIKKFPNSFLVYITAPLELRYERTKARKEKMDEGVASFEQFIEEEKVATELEIPIIAKGADVVIENNGTLEDFRNSIESFCVKINS
jgi:uridine kinase